MDTQPRIRILKNGISRKPRLRCGSSEFRGISKDQVCVLVARDRQKRTFSKTIGKGRIIKKSLDEALGSKLSIQNILCTDAWRTFMTYAKEKGIEHHRFKANDRERVKGIYHIQNVKVITAI